MPEDTLTAELERVSAELLQAKTEYASLGAKIAGLDAHCAALRRVITGRDEPGPNTDVIGKYRTDAIVEILETSGTEMSINDVVAALQGAGRPNETYDNVAADLAYLVERDRITRVRRGLYAARRDGSDHERIVTTLTQGNIDNGHVSLAKHMSFFPPESVGSPSAESGEGKPLSLTFEGLADVAVDTDIVSDKKIFRRRGIWARFFERHGLRAGDKIAIERTSAFKYHVSLA
jgi:hypothetical protein